MAIIGKTLYGRRPPRKEQEKCTLRVNLCTGVSGSLTYLPTSLGTKLKLKVQEGNPEGAGSSRSVEDDVVRRCPQENQTQEPTLASVKDSPSR